jgi:hypothetical protein
MPNNTARGVYASTAVRAESPANEVNGAMRKIARRSLPSFLATVFTMPRVRPRRAAGLVDVQGWEGHPADNILCLNYHLLFSSLQSRS